MRLLSWNIQQGGGTRIQKIIERINSHQADIIVLSEYKNHEKGLLLRTRLLLSGYVHQYVTGADKSKNSVLIASKLPAHFKHYLDVITDFPETIISAEFDHFKLYGMYLPHKKKHTLFDFLLKEIEDADKPCILAGDFNTGINFIDQKGDSFWYTNYLKELILLNYIDAFRFIHDEKRDYSWYSHQGNGFRYDHIWLHTDLVQYITDCDYIHNDRIDKVSDHSSMFMDLNL